MTTLSGTHGLDTIFGSAGADSIPGLGEEDVNNPTFDDFRHLLRKFLGRTRVGPSRALPPASLPPIIRQACLTRPGRAANSCAAQGALQNTLQNEAATWGG